MNVKAKKDINNAAHPIRKCAIDILETIEGITGRVFPKKRWYDLEDMITEKIHKLKGKK
jgi:hypothetical protein